ncbi:MAG: CPBP family intramembrane metalloprotease [Gemmatimonadota bacterium]|nr:MAG: CPBP family intramembrane metalloprotease [Gemmatimonadota bacterium]
MRTKKLEDYLAWIGLLALGTVAVALGSFPEPFRCLFAASFCILLIVSRLVLQLRRYTRVLDALFIVVLIWMLPLMPFYAEFHSLGKEPFFLIFGRSDLVDEVASNSMGGFFWILLPVVLVFIERDSLKDIFLTRGKTVGWSVGAAVLLVLMAVASIVVLTSGLQAGTYLASVPLGLTFALINAVKEEVLYRGLILGRTLRFGFRFALLCQLVWFVLIHMLYAGGGRSIGMMIGIAFFALVASWMTWKTESVAFAVQAHTGIDFMIFAASIPR